MPKAPRSFLEQLADYEDPAPQDVDPEDDAGGAAREESSSAEGDVIDAQNAREHYVKVGKSQLRGPDDIVLGSKYKGSKISRDDLELEQLDNEQDEPFGGPGLEELSESEEELEVDKDELDEVFEDFGSDGDDDDYDGSQDEDEPIPETFSSSPSASTNEEEDDRDLEISDESDLNSPKEDDSTEGGVDDSASSSADVSMARSDSKNRAALRKLMAEERKSVAASISTAVKNDIAKGRAIKKQRSTFDSLLNTRMMLQKALIAVNSMTLDSETMATGSDNVATDYVLASRGAEEAALNLWKSLTSLHESLDSSPNTKKRPLSAATNTSSQSLWDTNMNLETKARETRRQVLTKWSQRTNPSASVQSQHRFSQVPAQASLTSVLDRQMSGEGLERAVKRTRVARSCAPIQASSKTLVEDDRIYDDADFYTLLLRELVDRRMVDSRTSSAVAATTPDITANILPNQAELKVKKPVDTKASKGRKMRYNVHEKLQNFMVADDWGSWGARQRAELFGSLLGRKVEMAEGDCQDEMIVDSDHDDGDEDNAALEGNRLKLFGR